MSFPNEKRLRNISRQTLILTAATYALSAFRYGAMRLLNCQRAGGQAFTLPKANGKQGKFRFYIGTTVTSSTTIRTNGGTDVIGGMANVQTSQFQSLVSTGNNTITLNGTTTGGLAGGMIYLEDVGPGQWYAEVNTPGSGTAATPFSIT